MRSGNQTFFGPAPEQLSQQQRDAKARHIASVGAIFQRCHNAYRYFKKDDDAAYKQIMGFLTDFTSEYNQLTDSEKNQVTNLIIKSISKYDIFWLFPLIIGYASSMVIDGIVVEKFPMRAAEAVRKEFDDCDYWPWNRDKTEKKKATLRAMDNQATRDFNNRERAERFRK